MISIALSLLLAQTTPTSAEIQGAKNVIAQTIAEYQQGLRTFTFNAGRTEICINPLPTRPIPVGAVTTRHGAVILTPELLASLGIPAAPKDDYAGFDVQALPVESMTYDPVATAALWDILDPAVTKIAGPINAACEVLVVRAGSSQISTWLPCACRTGNPCTYDPDGAGPIPSQSGTAINGATLPAGTWSGGGCRPKSCYTRFDGIGVDNSWPTECPK